jgi:hypothetical protein
MATDEAFLFALVLISGANVRWERIAHANNDTTHSHQERSGEALRKQYAAINLKPPHVWVVKSYELVSVVCLL